MWMTDCRFSPKKTLETKRTEGTTKRERPKKISTDNIERIEGKIGKRRDELKRIPKNREAH